MKTSRPCPQCLQPLAPDAPDGLCPQCLMKAAAGPPPSAAGRGLADDFIDIGDPAEVARKLPQFEILELLGRGGMGVVYKARQLQLDRIVALKILPPVDALSPDFVARFTREARALAKLNHPNIVNVHDFGETGGLYYIVMEYVDGANLRQLFEARKLTPAEVLAIVPKICDALQYAHDEGLVHRDIKPENLLIDKKGRVKIADFGLAKLLRREPLDMTLTLSGMALGTLRYMAPEQMDKPETVDHRADLYSLGVVIYEMLTGETPVGRFELPSQKAQVDVRLDEIVLHALEKEPARRYQHASEIRTDVQQVTDQPKAAAEGDRPAPLVAVDPAQVGEAKPEALRPWPRFFWRRTFGKLILGWLALAALSNYGLTGFVLGSVVAMAIVWEIGRTHADRNPLWAEKIQAIGQGKLVANLFTVLLIHSLFLMMIISGLFRCWDSCNMWPTILAPTSAEFEARYQGKEYQLLRQLTAFKDQVPTVELTKDYFGSRSSADQVPAPFVWLWTVYGALMIFFFFKQAAGKQARVERGVRPGGWRVALASTGVFLASLLGAFSVLGLLSLVHWNGPATNVNSTLRIQANVGQANESLRRWAAENGYASMSDNWSLQSVPKGEQVARAELFDAWKVSPFERWRVTTFGFDRLFPRISVQVIGSEKPAQSAIAINTFYDSASTVEPGSDKQRRWKAIVQSLSDAVSKNAPGIDPSKPVATFTVKETETSSPWPGLCGVLVAMVGWAFARARILKAATATPKAASQAAQPADVYDSGNNQ